jgi:hypothetical protein
MSVLSPAGEGQPLAGRWNWINQYSMGILPCITAAGISRCLSILGVRQTTDERGGWGAMSTGTEDEDRRAYEGDPERHFLIFCDESGVHGTSTTGFGTLWMPWERRGDFAALWTTLKARHFPPSEVKWEKVKARTLPFFEALVDEFFRHRWLMFHALVVRKDDVNLSLHDGDWDLARRKYFVMLLRNKLVRFAAPGKKYRIRVDPIASRYRKANEAAEVVLNNQLNQELRLRHEGCIHSLRTVDSKSSPGVQLSDLLLGAVKDARVRQSTSEAKQMLLGRIAHRLGWPSLEFDTYPGETKFNVWRFWDPMSGKPRPETTRKAVNLTAAGP